MLPAKQPESKVRGSHHRSHHAAAREPDRGWVITLVWVPPLLLVTTAVATAATAWSRFAAAAAVLVAAASAPLLHFRSSSLRARNEKSLIPSLPFLFLLARNSWKEEILPGPVFFQGVKVTLTPILVWSGGSNYIMFHWPSNNKFGPLALPPNLSWKFGAIVIPGRTGAGNPMNPYALGA